VVKTVRKNPDADLLAALEYLRRQFPEEFQWSEHAAWVYFQKGDMRRSLSILGPLIGGNLRGMRVQSLLIASEAARIEGIQKRAVGILEAAHAMYPEKASILNNLVYNLAQDQATVARARELLPGLLQIGGDSYAILDTAAFVYLRSGQLERAREYMRRALTAAGDADYGVHEVRLNAAEILLRSGDYTAARQQIQGVRQDKTRSELVDMRAVELLRELDIRVKKK
jgi:tetratricopeptide (TPR) repeat protein